jgi:type II secretion system protein D
MHLTRSRLFTSAAFAALGLSSALAQQPAAATAPEAPKTEAPAPAEAPAAPAAPAPAKPDATAPAPGGSGSPGGPVGMAPGGPPGGGFGPPGGFRRREGGFGGPGGPPGGGQDLGGTLSQTIRMDGDKIVLQFPNNPVMDMLSIYELLTGVTLIKDTNILEGAPVSLATPKPVEKAEAVKLIEATLLTNGYAIVMEEDGKSARILPARNQGANAVQFSHGVRFYTSAQDLPDGETIVSYFMKLDYMDPAEAAEIFSGHVGLSVYGRITPVVTPPGLLITESSTVVKQLVSIREAIDLGDTGSSLVTKFIPIVYAEASVVAQIIQATLTAQAQEKETKGINTIRGNVASDGRSSSKEERREERDNRPAPPIIVNGQVVQQNSQAAQPSAQVIADTRLNQLLVVAAPADYAYVASLIAEFDKPLEASMPYERKLKYAAAVDVLSALVDLLQDTSGGATQLPGGGSIQQQRGGGITSSSSQLLSGRSTTGTRGGQVLSTSGSSDTATGSTGSVNRADIIQGPTEDNAPVSVLVGKTRVVADPMSNTILVVGRQEEIDKVTSMLDMLDRRPAQVYLATVIGQLNLGDDFDLGIDLLGTVKDRSGRGNNFTAGNLISGNPPGVNDLTTNIASALAAGSGLNLYGQIGDNVEYYLSALESTNRFKVLSRPSVFALNNKKATITSGTLIPVPTQSNTNQNTGNGNITVSYDFQDVVLKLEVVPLINDDGEVHLTIAQVNDTVTGEKSFPNVGTLPIIATEQVVTSVTVRDRNTIVLGGLISEQSEKKDSGTPFLSRVPGVGNLFKRNQSTTTRKELIIFIQPQVVRDGAEIQVTSSHEDYRTTVGADAAARFPEAMDITAERVSNAEEEARREAEKKKGSIFSRMFKSSGKKPKQENFVPGSLR